jgi:hypothetical protein
MLYRYADLDDTLYGRDVIEYYLGYISNPVGSTIAKWRTFKLLWWVQLLNGFVDSDEILHGGDNVGGDIDIIILNLIA